MPRQLSSVPIPKPVTWFAAIRPRSAHAAVGVLTLLAVVSILGMMWQPGGAGNNARLPPPLGTGWQHQLPKLDTRSYDLGHIKRPGNPPAGCTGG